MILKKYLFIAFICSFLIGQTNNAMEEQDVGNEDITSMIQDRTIIIECLDENEQQLFTFEMPHQALLLSKTLTNVLGDSDENTDTITISAPMLDFSPMSLQTMLSIIKEFSHNKSPLLFINLLSLTNIDLLQLVNASSYLACEDLHKYLITTLMMHIRSSINDIPSLTQALEFAQMLDNTDHVEHLTSYAPLAPQITYFTKDIATLNDHNKRISALCYSPNGKVLATASWDQTIKIWDIATNTYIKTLTGHEGNILSLNFSPDGTKLISCCDRQTVKIWDIKTEKCLQTIESIEIITSACFSPLDNNLIAIAAYNYLSIYPNYLEDKNYELNGHAGEINQVIFSPHGDYIASHDDRTIKIWSTADYLCQHTFEGHKENISTFCFSPDGKKIVSADTDGMIKIWDLSSRQCINTFKAHELSINSLCYAPNNAIFASAGDESLIKLWDASGECINGIQSLDVINAISFTPDSLQLAAGLKNSIIELYSFHTIKKEFSLSSMLLLEYMMQNNRQQLPSNALYFDLFAQLPIVFQHRYSYLIDQHALMDYHNNK